MAGGVAGGAGPGRAVASSAPERTNWAAVVAVGLGIVLVALDMTIVAVALPAIGGDFGLAPEPTQWVLLAYSLPLVALSVSAGRWLDRCGLRPAFALAVVGFGAASMLIAAAPGFGALLAGRAAQGVFGSLVGVVGMPIVARAVAPGQRARAMGVITTLIPLSGVAGPGLGGVLTDAFGWRSVFLVNLPVVLAALVLGLRAVPAGGRLVRPGGRLLGEAAVLGAAGVGLFLALDLLGRGSGWVAPVALLAVAAVAALVWARLPQSAGVIGLMRRPALAWSLLAMALITVGVGALNFLVPYFLAEVGGVSSRGIGLALLALSAAMAAFSPLAGSLADRFGARALTTTGAALVVAGLATMLTLGAGAAPVDVAWRLAVVGTGLGLFSGPNAAVVLADAPEGAMGATSGLTSLLRTLGFAVGPATAALSWSVSDDGVGALRLGVAVLVVAGVGALAAVVRAARAVAPPT